MNIIDFYYKNKKPLILDGAIGSYLETKFPTKNHKTEWMNEINHNNKSDLKKLYLDYIENGADIITTNTFRTNPLSFDKAKNIDMISASEVEIAVNICKEVKELYPGVFIAGSNSSAEECYSGKRKFTYKELKHNHITHVNNLYSSGCDFVFNETQSHMDEIKIILSHCEEIGIPYAISLYFGPTLNILSGESLSDVLKFLLENSNPMFIGFNCIPLESLQKALSCTPEISLIKRLGIYPNCGDIDINAIPNFLKTVNLTNLFLIGTCCMSDPSFIKPIADAYK
jgi:homocysteine S-methyltransferase